MGVNNTLFNDRPPAEIFFFRMHALADACDYSFESVNERGQAYGSFVNGQRDVLASLLRKNCWITRE